MDDLISDQYIGPPRLMGFSLEKKSNPGKKESDEGKSDANSCILSMDLEDKLYFSGSSKSTVQIELQPATVDTMLDALYRIKNQLSMFSDKQTNSLS